MRSYGEAIDVRTAAGERAAPAQFLWRGRLYLVREVLAHWVELGTWWSAPRRPATRPAPPGPRSVAADVGAVEREVWRVEAAPGRSVAVGVYDLVRDVPTPDPVPEGEESRWRLARALD